MTVILGPCELYCDPDLLECGQGGGVDMLPYAQAATMILYELSGHAFPGACSRTVRPCRSACGCTWVLPGLSQASAQWFWQGSYWRDPNAGGQCGCGCLDQVTLAGYPVRSIDEVTIDGVVVDPATYRLDRHRHLVRVHPHHWPACFPAETLILTSDGLKPISDVRAGDSVLTHRNRWRQVLASRQTGVEPLVRIKGRGGDLRCTADHLILSRSVDAAMERRDDRARARLGDSEGWLWASHMMGHAWATPGECEALPIPLPERWSDADLPSNFWWVVGRWLGDGWTDSANRVTLCCDIREADDLAEALADTGWSWRDSGGSRTCARWRFNSKPLTDWLRQWFGTSAHNKQIPAWVFGADAAIRSDLLAGYVSADGWRGHVSSGKGKAYTSTHTVSRKLAIGTRILAGTLGNSAMVYAGRANSSIDHPTYRVNWPEARPGEAYSQAWATDDHLWGRIRSIESEPIAVPVYDIQVEEDESFVADGVVVHNCQNLAVLDSEPGAFAIIYTWGAAPPALANLAAIELACWLFRQSPPSDACEIPANVTNIIRQGVTMQLQGKVEGAAASLSMVGSFLEAYNPGKRRRSSGAWSPDVRYPRPRGAS